MAGTLSRTAFGDVIPVGSLRNTGTLTGRLSLISTWKTPESSRAYYDSAQSHELDVKLRAANLGPRLLPLLQAADRDNTGFVAAHVLSKILMLHFNVLLTPGEINCLKAEWQVMDHLTGIVHYTSLCEFATQGYMPEATRISLGVSM